VSYKIPKLTLKEAEEIRDDLVWLFYDAKDMYPDYSLREICEEVVINYRWVREWSQNYQEWAELFEELDKEIELPRLDFGG